jgi:Hexameric tyrosine-coordinated heme protein (HTHP)
VAQDFENRQSQEHFELAIKLSPMGVKYTQPAAEIRDKVGPTYAENADSLIAASQVVATNGPSQQPMITGLLMLIARTSDQSRARCKHRGK